VGPRMLAGGMAFVLFVPLLAACNRGDSGPEAPVIPASFTFKGEVRLSGAGNVFGGLDNCAGVGRYADIHRGASVTVTNQIGKPIAIGEVSYGLGTNYYRDVLDECTFRLDVASVPRAKAYIVIIARGQPQPISLASIVATNGQLVYDVNTPLVDRGVPQ